MGGKGGSRPRAAVTVVAVVVAVSACGGWPMFRAGPARTGATVERTVSPESRDALTTLFVGSLGAQVDRSSPVVANGAAYIGSVDGVLSVFDANGVAGCSGSPGACAPLWTGVTGDDIQSSPAVVNGVVYVGSTDHRLYAFDAAGSTNCSGSPKVCLPLWTATTGDQIVSSPVVANGSVYIGSLDHKLYAFDAAGTTGCSGSPKTCVPLWTATTGGYVYSSPAVANGKVYVGSFDDKLYAFDAAGSMNCSGSPKTCSPLWTATTAGQIYSTPAVADSRVFVASWDSKLYAFDAAGTTSCSGVPKVCAPLWTGGIGQFTFSSPAVANGVVYIGADQELDAFDAEGATNCSGAPKQCSPLWTGAIHGDAFSSPAVGNGVVYIGSGDHRLYGFDAAGTLDCTGVPKACTPLWTGLTGDLVHSSPAILDGVIYVGSWDRHVYAFAESWSSGRFNTAATGSNPHERTISLGNATSLTSRFELDTGGDVDAAPIIVNGVAFVASGSHVFAFDADGHDNCTSLGAICQPLWSDAMSLVAGIVGSPSVIGDVLYVVSAEGRLWAFPRDGSNCPGNPKTCQPLWVVTLPEHPVESSPVVTNGVVFTGSSNSTTHAWDAAGGTDCGGPDPQNPCTPLRTYSPGSWTTPAVADGILVGSGPGVVGSDAAGVQNCSGTPAVCAPLWRSAQTTTIGNFFTAPAVAGGVVYVGAIDGTVSAYDLTGAQNCSGSPKTCQPLWTATTGDQFSAPPAVSGGVLYLTGDNRTLYAFDAKGTTNCSGTPKTCTTLWTATVATDTSDSIFGSPSVANGLVYVSTVHDRIAAYPAAGSVGCSGSPKTCTARWSRPASGYTSFSSPSIVNGLVYVARRTSGASTSVEVFGLP